MNQPLLDIPSRVAPDGKPRVCTICDDAIGVLHVADALSHLPPHDRTDLGFYEAASMLARCAAPDRYFPMVQMLYRSQSNWARAANPAAALAQIGRLAGISQKSFDACMGNRELYESIIKSRTTARKTKQVRSTPTLFLGEKMVQGGLTAANLRILLDAALRKAAAK